jgi:four helix bundle protein
MSMTFEDLEAWQRARVLVNAIYAMTRDGALAKDFGLSGQIQRAAVSVMSNVAEGFERQHAAEKMQAYNVARASCGEVRSLLYVIEDNYPLSHRAAADARDLARETGRLVTGIIASTRRRVVGKTAALGIGVWAVVWLSCHLLSSIS